MYTAIKYRGLPIIKKHYFMHLFTLHKPNKLVNQRFKMEMISPLETSRQLFERSYLLIKNIKGVF